MDHLRQDLRHAARRLLRRPGFAAIAILTLGLGIGANVAIYTVVRAVLLEPLPYAEADRLALVVNLRKGVLEGGWISEPEALEVREGVSSFENVAYWTSGAANVASGAGDPERVVTARVTAGLFDVLAVPAAAGRYFAADEWRRGGPPVAVLGHGLWQRRFGGAASVIGSTLLVNNEAHTIVGVLPAGVGLPIDYEATRPTELFVPLPLERDSLMEGRGSHYLLGIARLRPDATIARANAELATIARGWIVDGFVSEADALLPVARPLSDAIVGAARPLLFVLAGAVAFLLLIACVNVANLLLARGDERRREIAVRASLGAGRARIIRQLLIESGLLALVGGALGLLLAQAGVRALIALGPTAIPRIGEVEMDAGVLLFAVGIALLTAVLFGLVPALQLSRAELGRELREGGRSATGGRSRQRFRHSLVVAELALSVMLVIGAGLMVRTFAALQRIDLGFDRSSVITAQLSLPLLGYEEDEQVERFVRDIVNDIRALPGVQHAGAGRLLPLTGEIGDWSITLEGIPARDGADHDADWQIVTDGYFEAMGMRLVRGRWFTSTDDRDAPPVAVVSRALAEAYWPGGDAIGRRYRIGTNPDRPWVTIVGIVENVRHNEVLETPRREMYVPHAQWSTASQTGARRTMAIVARTTDDPLALVPALRAAVRARDPGVPLSDVRTLDRIVGGAVSGTRFTTLLLTLFASIALVLATVGTYGVIAYGVAQRRHEMGIRMALGASRGDVIRLVLTSGGGIAAIGIGVGVAGALALSRLMSGLVYGVPALDPVTYLVVPAILAAAALLACWIPARRAAATHPAAALRTDEG